MTQKRWRGTLLYLGVLAASVATVGLRTLPPSDAAALNSQPTAGATSTPHPTTPSSRPSPPRKPAAAVTVTGAPASTRYGVVQVAVTFQGSQITDVTALRTPNGDGRSVQIADAAVPTLREEVIRSQSAHIDSVSGATYTSDGYAQSVQSAIDQH
ncbi:hypothetical protein GCM10009616_34640 [Microlunatus lacustris]